MDWTKMFRPTHLHKQASFSDEPSPSSNHHQGTTGRRRSDAGEALIAADVDWNGCGAEPRSPNGAAAARKVSISRSGRYKSKAKQRARLVQPEEGATPAAAAVSSSAGAVDGKVCDRVQAAVVDSASETTSPIRSPSSKTSGFQYDAGAAGATGGSHVNHVAPPRSADAPTERPGCQLPAVPTSTPKEVKAEVGRTVPEPAGFDCDSTDL